MRLFEVILLIVCTVFPFLYLFNFSSRNKLTGLSIISVLFIMHVFLEGLRWQMISGYLIALVIIIFLLGKIRFQAKGKLAVTLTLFFLIISLGIGWTIPIIFPVFKLPTPSGEYKVGSQYLKIMSDHLEVITEDPEDKRAIMVKVWYPSVVVNEEKESYLNQGNRLGFSSKYGLPESITHYLDYVETNTYQKPQIAEEKFPILIFSHGSNAEAFGYYALMEEIVSHGYIIFNINHTYESSGSLFPDGEIKLYDKAFDQKTNTEIMGEMAWNAIQEYEKANNEYDQLLAVEDLIRNYVAAEISLRWSKDISEVIDRLAQWNETSFLSGHLDLSKVGVFGHSQGGSAVGQAMLDDDRIMAGINLDGVQWGVMIDTTIQKPFLLVSSDWDQEHLNLNKFAYRNLDNFNSIVIRDAGHSNFMDIPLLVNFSLINEAGKINPYRAYQITSELILDFFDKSLKGRSENLIDYANTYQEVEIAD
ncbi:alpha/beta hydrolase family protein [Aquiflexum lacus]|uniref:alpha/beta hydrolase family protein n=1 Tax=Aquiflexum lacus TaxID=2483805 RepID=UPI001894FC97|nr:hypothetical protein [Aquiflexum lacus]